MQDAKCPTNTVPQVEILVEILTDAVDRKARQIYTRLVADEKLKTGTAYERLAAMVFHLLNRQTTVHDLRLRGRSGVLHQIDVTAGVEGDRKRTLIECKDYDKPVGLALVRSFFGVVEDTRPDGAFVVTTERFTGPAQKYAKAKCITLALLRPPRDEDWEGIVRTINLEIVATVPVSAASVELAVGVEDVAAPPSVEVAQGAVPVDAIELINAAGVRRPFEPELTRVLGSVPLGFQGEWRADHQWSEPTWVTIGGQDPVRLLGFSTRQSWGVLRHQSSIGHGIGGLSAELVLRTLDGSVHRIFSNRDLQKWTFDSDGHVVPSGEAS